jgi:hypothetical protein
MLHRTKQLVVRRCQTWVMSRMGKNSPSHFCDCLMYAQTDARQSTVMKKKGVFHVLTRTNSMDAMSQFAVQFKHSDTVVLLNQCINAALAVCFHCHFRPATLRLVSDLCFSTLKMPDPTSHCTHINSMLSMHTVPVPMNFYGTNLLSSKNSNTTLCFVLVTTSDILNCLCIVLMWLIIMPLTPEKLENVIV